MWSLVLFDSITKLVATLLGLHCAIVYLDLVTDNNDNNEKHINPISSPFESF